MDKEDLLKLKELIENELEKVEKIEEIKKGVRQKPEEGEIYFYLSSDGNIECTTWRQDAVDLYRFNTGNCFKTEQEVKEYKENLLTKQALKDLALELNNGVEIDWGNSRQPKHYLYIDYETNLLSTEYAVISQENIVYCLNNQFLTIAKDRIGEDKLIKLIKSGV